ncbi:hypothetical protein EL84_03410 [Paenibacillus sp. VT-400]|nr:hypothetical protein EL84_03410 [Paenibacillus sp. VT-400]
MAMAIRRVYPVKEPMRANNFLMITTSFLTWQSIKRFPIYIIPQKRRLSDRSRLFYMQNLIDIIMEAKNYTITEIAEPI